MGFRQLPIGEFTRAVSKLRPDIVVGPGDIPYGVDKVSKKKTEKVTDRTTKWMLEHVQARRLSKKNAEGLPPLYAPLLPLPIESQRWYIEHLLEDMIQDVDGLAVYDTCALQGLPVEMQHLPRLGFTAPKSPAAILEHISLGMDVFTVPFIGAVTDAGIAMDFAFPVNEEDKTARSEPRVLGVDMWQVAHAADLSPLTSDCSCYACTNHHRAFVQHLLAAKEMLGWVLLQMHNHHIMDVFFAGVRKSIACGTFEDDCAAFRRVYEPDLPAKTGQGPRYDLHRLAARNKSTDSKQSERLPIQG